MSSLLLKMTACPRRALDLNINASLEFLDQTLPADLAAVNRAYQNEKLLEQSPNPLERISSNLLHKPTNEKWIAARLHIPHEWLYRLSPRLFRELSRREDKRKGRVIEAGDEVWLHCKPTEKSLKQYLDRTGRSTSDAVHQKTSDGTTTAEPVIPQNPPL